MKGKILIIPISLLSIILAVNLLLKPKLPDSQKVLGVPTTDPQAKQVIQLNNISINYRYYILTDASSLNLYPNYENKFLSKQIMQDYHCRQLTNGGFYNKQNEPIGLLILNHQKYSDKINSLTFNGFFTINDFEVPRITDYLPQDSLRLALQSGPVLFKNGQPEDIKILNDEFSRRIVLAVTGENNIVFIAFFIEDSLFSGPYLSSLPSLIKKFEEETGIQIADAVNLDGGTASVFINNTVSLNEAVAVGSFFCVKIDM